MKATVLVRGRFLALICVMAFGMAGLLGLTGCKKEGGTSTTAITAGKFIVLDTKTDMGDRSAAKQNAENTLQKYPDIDAMVGLWAYNAPACMEALKDAGKLGAVKVFSFDEADATLQAILDGHCEGTVVQQPFEFGYQAVKYLKMIDDGKTVDVPESKEIDIPAKTITKDNCQGFWDTCKELQALGKAAAESERPKSDQKFAFVINGPDPFWNFAQAGCFKAEQDFKVRCDFRTPPSGDAAEQNSILENIVSKGDYKGVAVSPLDPINQTAAMDAVAEKMPLLCHDSDAPKSKRMFYLGTNNIEAGRMLGELVKARMPEGGKIMVFVGNMDVLNAQQRRQGLIEALGSE